MHWRSCCCGRTIGVAVRWVAVSIRHPRRYFHPCETVVKVWHALCELASLSQHNQKNSILKIRHDFAFSNEALTSSYNFDPIFPFHTGNPATIWLNWLFSNHIITKTSLNIHKKLSPKTFPNIPKPSQISPKTYPKTFPKTSPKHPQNIPKTSPKHPQNIPKTSPKHPQNIPKTSPKHPQNIPKNIPKKPPKRQAGDVKTSSYVVVLNYENNSTSRMPILLFCCTPSTLCPLQPRFLLPLDTLLYTRPIRLHYPLYWDILHLYFV